MGGVFLLSMKTASQKYCIDGLQEEKASMQEKNESLMTMFTNWKKIICVGDQAQL